MKYTPAYPSKPFGDIDEARACVQRFVTWYNTVHRHSGIQFVTPAQRHAGTDKAILDKRIAVYEQAKREHPHRWRGRIVRNWQPVGTVWLNPDSQAGESGEIARLAA